MLNWTHDPKTCPTQPCPGTTECESFPTPQDRINMARAAYEAYAEADGTDLPTFVHDVLLLASSEGLQGLVRGWR